MLAVNGKPIVELPKDDPLAAHIRAAMKAIKSHGHFKLVTDDSKVLPPKPGLPSSVKEMGQGILQPASGKYMFEGMEHDITYYTSIQHTENGGTRFSPRYVDFDNILPLDPKKQSDLIFYMICVSSACRPYYKLDKYQYLREGSTYYYKVEDLQADILKSNEYMRLTAKAKKIIWDEDTGIPITQLRDIAKHYGFPNADNMDIEFLKFELDKSLLNPTSGKVDYDLVNKFLRDAKDDTMLKLKESIRRAISSHYYVVDKNTANKDSWYTTDKYLQRKDHLMTISEGAEPELALLQYFAASPKRRGELDKYLKTEKFSNSSMNPVEK